MKLDDDLLWLIAMINASDTAYRKHERLATTRISSQVCRRWRGVILGSPAMSGRLILLDQCQRTEWIEVFTRALSSLLWIEIDAQRPSTSTENYEYLLSYVPRVRQNWGRIEMLHAIIGNDFGHEHPLYEKLFDCMATPSPALRSCSITNPYIAKLEPKNLPTNIFLGNVPRLVRVVFSGFRIASKSNWLSKLNELCFSPTSIEDISNVLSWAPRVEAFGIDTNSRCFLPSNDADFSKLASMSSVILPRLASIRAIMSLDAMNALWSSSSAPPDETYIDISVHPDYSLDSSIQLPRTLANIIRIGPMANTIQKIQCFVGIISVSRIIFLRISIQTKNKTVRLCFTCGGPRNFGIALFFLQYLSPHIHGAGSLSLQLTPDVEEFPWSQVLCKGILPVNKVTSIIPDDISIAMFNKIEESGVTLFPNLEMFRCYRAVYSHQTFARHLKSFFRRRLQRGEVLPCVRLWVPHSLLQYFKDKRRQEPSDFWLGSRVEVE